MKWIVFDKDGLTAKCEVRSLQYSGEFMGACSITAKVVSPNPVDFEIGDYLLYRGERFEINYDPTVLKQASSGSYVEGFVYDNIVFNSLSDELTRCDFLDYVPNDNNLHYSSLPNFSFFADSVQKLAERIQVNLDRIYTGDKQWTVNVNTEKIGKTDVNVVINTQTCWDALALVKSEFGLNFIIRGRTITIGTEGIAVGKVFSYGKGNGLISVERNAESDQKVITRLRAYGSTKNMPESYYKNVGLQVFGELIWRMFANTFYLNIPYEAKLFTKSSERGKEVVFKVNGEESTGYVTRHTATDEFEGCCELHFDSSELASKLQEGMKVYFTAHVNKTEFPRANKEYAENVPNNMAVRHLMLPSFPTETTDPYIDSENIGELGIREATVFFDGSNGNEEIYPSMEGMTAEDLKAAGVECAAEGALDEVVSAEQIEDDGFFKEGSKIETFKITLKDVGFDINDHLSVSGNATIAFNTGMCGGRDFEIVECKKEGANYVLTCNRHYDESLDLYFPYKEYQIKGGDKFVLINIEMPDVYVQAASQRLLTAAKWYLGNNDYVRYSYVPRIDNIFLAREHDEAVKNGEASIHDTIKEGDLMLFHDTDLGIEGSVIIDTLSIREGESLIPEYEVTLRNNKTVGTITKIQNQIDSIVSGKVGTGGGYNAAQIKSLIDSYGQTLFLSKTKDDRSKGKIATDKAIEVGDYVSGASGAIIYKDAENGQTVGEIDKLYVRMKAYFETLEIINVNSVGGKQILSPAGSVKCIGVEETDNAYRCYFLAEQDGEKVQNRFLVNDQIYSQMFDAVEGTSQNVSTHYFWRLCIAKSKEPVTFENKSCHYIDLSKTDCDKDSDVPMVGDVLNQRGNRTDLDRMNFIEMSSVDAFSPNITLFHGVNSYSLDGKAYVSYGVDKSTNKAFMDVYGDMYVGDRQNSSYMRYTQENGLEISGTLSIGTKLGDTPLKDLISASSPEGYQEFVEKVTQDIEGLQAQIDGAIESYFFQYDPTLGNYPASEWITEEQKKAHLNDTFTNVSEDSGHSWRWSLVGTTYNWVEIKDTATAKALQVAGQAKDTADGKRRVFVDTPYPPYDKGDLWSRGSEYPLMICINGKSKDKGEVYEASDWDYADNNAKLKEEMQELVGDTKDELNNAIGQAKNEAVNNANAYTDEGKKALQASIDAMESTKANLDDVYTRAQADGKISETEAKALKAAEEEADAAIAYYDTIVKAYADGVATEEELKEIQGAKAALDAAKKYAEEQAQKAIDEANDTYGYLAKALGTEVDGGLLLTSLIQMRDTDQNIMSGINGLTAKGGKSIATWWGGGMYDMFDYYDWDGAKWVAKKNIQIPSNVPSGVIRMDGTGYLAKGKFWWDESGKIYADPTALFLMFDVEDESASLSQTILAMRDKQTEFESMWEFKTDANGRKYLLSKYPLVTQEGVTMYSGASTTIPSIYDGLPIDGVTIYWENGILKAQGGGSEGINEEQLENYLNTNNYAKKSDIPSLSGYATQTWVASQGYITGITSAMVTSALGFTPYNADNFTKAKIKSTLGISDWALAESKPSYTYAEIGGTPDLSVYALKTSLSSYQPLISTTNKLAYSLVSGTPTSLKNPTSLTFGSKTYDGSEAKTISASDLGALTSHQTIYALKLQSGTFSAGTYTPNSEAKTINIPTTTAHISESGNLYFTDARAVNALSSTLANYVTLGSSQTITGAKNFTGGLSVNGGSLVYNASEGYWKLEGNLLVTGGVSMYNSGNSDIPSGGGGGSIDYPLKWSGFSSGSFDGSAAKTIYIPSKLSELTNDSGYALSSALSGYLPKTGGTIDSGTNWTELYVKSTNANLGFISYGSDSYIQSNVLRMTGVGGISGYLLNFTFDNITVGTEGHSVYHSGMIPTIKTHLGLATVATSGSYNDLSNKPTIPTNTNQLTNGAGFITSSALNRYLPLSGGKLTGSVANVLSIDSGDYQDSNGRSAVINFYGGGERGMQIGFTTTTGVYMYKQSGYFLGIDNNNVPYFGTSQFHYTFWHEGNFNPSDYLPKSGGTLTGVLTLSSGYDKKLILDNTDNDSKYQYISFRQNGTEYGTLGTSFDDNLLWNQSYILHSKNYSSYALPLSGGNIGDGTKGTPLILTGNQTIVELLLKSSNGTTKGSCVWQDGYGVFIYNYTIGALLGIKDDGTPVYGNNTLIHSGNIGSQSVANADKLDGIHSYDFFRMIAFNPDINSYGDGSNANGIIYINTSDNNSIHAPFNYGSILSMNYDAASWMLSCGSNGSLGFRHRWWSGNGTAWSDWKTIAFTDSNVSSATKLQTARTIWGQSFDGTGNVSGRLDMDSLVYFMQGGTAHGYLGFASSDTDLYLSANRNLFISGKNNLILNGYSDQGNVGIGTTNPGEKLHVVGKIYATNGIGTDGGLSVIGNVGIGTTNPDSKLHVSGDLHIENFSYFGNQTIITRGDKTYDTAYIAERTDINRKIRFGIGQSNNRGIYDDTLGWIFKVAPNDKLNIGNGNYVGIGTDTPYYNLDISGTFNASSNASIGGTLSVAGSATFTGKTTHNGGISASGLSFTGTYTIAFDSNGNITLNSANGTYWHVDTSSGSQVLVCTSSGNVGIGTSSPSTKLHVSGNILTSGSITMNSMRSMKNIINENGLSLEELSTIKPTRFTWKDGRDDRIHVGGIADDVMKVLPEVVFKGSDGVLSMDYASAAFVMAASLIQPMTEHERRIANLERENALLKEEIRNLKRA